MSSVADLDQWRPAIPEGEVLLAAAPMFGEWRGPAMNGWRAILPGAIAGMTYPVATTFAVGEHVFWVALAWLVALALGSLIWRRWWRKRHPGPTGMAAAVDWKWGRGPVLLVTGSGVLQTGLRGGANGRVRSSTRGKEIPGLIAVDAVDERLVLRFEDGSEAALRQRWPTDGAADRVAELAASVLRQRQAHEPPAVSVQ